MQSRNTLHLLAVSAATLLMLSGAVFGQDSGSLSGVITDGESGLPLQGANVFIEELSKGSASDADGRYTILNIPAGTYTISASYVGYRIVKTRVEHTGESQILDFSLMPKLLQGQEVTITATRAKRRETPVAFTNLSAEEIRERRPKPSCRRHAPGPGTRRPRRA